MRNRRRQYSEARHPGYVCEFRSDLRKRLFGEAPLCHVLNCADVLRFTAMGTAVGDHVDVFDRAVGHLQPDLKLYIAAITARSFQARTRGTPTYQPERIPISKRRAIAT